MQKVIVTVVGKDTFGIIARVGAYMAEKRINILDITQTIVSGYFNMLTLALTIWRRDWIKSAENWV